MGVVYLASSQGAHGFEKLVALKCLHRHLTRDAEQMQALFREAMLGVTLSHEHIVDVFDLGEEEDIYFVVMEFVRGVSLAHVLPVLSSIGPDDDRGPGPALPIAHALHITRAIARALVHVHGVIGPEGERVIHGDVSPGNVLLGVDGRIKLSDFGVSAISAQVRSDRIAGKLAYLPPEALAGAGPVQSWDVYALVATLAVMLQAPCAQGRARELIRRIRKDGARDSLGRELPSALAAVLDRGLHNRSERRFETAADLITALDDAHPRSPYQGDDFATWIAALYGSSGFVERHGEIPTTGRWSSQLELAPALAETAAAQPVTSRSVPKHTSVLRFGLSPAVGVEQTRVLGSQLDETLSSLLDRQVSSSVVGDYRGLVDGLCNGELDLAWMPPLAFIEAWERGVELLVASQRGDGARSYHGVIFTRPGSSLTQLSDLRGARMGWVSPESASGYVFPAAAIIEQLGGLDEVLGKQHFFGTHRAVHQAVLNDWVDAGATFASLDRDHRPVSTGWEVLDPGAEAMVSLHFSHPIPSDNVAHRPHLPAPLVDRIREAFLELSSSQQGREMIRAVFGVTAFVEADVELYEDARAVWEAVSGETARSAGGDE